MRLVCLLFLLFSILQTTYTSGQSISSQDHFQLEGHILGKDTGRVVFYYFDAKNIPKKDTIALHKGYFIVSGTVNIACEALLWTDLTNKVFDDPTVIRFLLVPNETHVNFDSLHPEMCTILGSEPQKEWEKWKMENRELNVEQEELFGKIRSFAKAAKSDSGMPARQALERTEYQYDSIRVRIRVADARYIGSHPTSILSGYLLNRQARWLSVPRLQELYTSLGANVRRSTIGYLILRQLYTRTDDVSFRKSNPLIDSSFTANLNMVHSFYDLSLSNMSGNRESLSRYRGKIVVVDFWASWCAPCINNIPFLQKLILKYSRDSVVFISVSLDQDPASWKRAVKRFKFPGIQLSDTTGFYSQAAVYCKALWVPTYVILNQDGKVLNYNAPQASEPELAKKLDQLLTQRP